MGDSKPKPKLKELIREIIAEHGLDTLTKKQIRRLMEKKLGVEEGTLENDDELKGRINKHVETIISEIQATKNDEPSEEETDAASDSDSGPPAPKSKGAKRPASDAEGSGTPAKKAKPATVVTQSGEVAPKGVKNQQCRIFTGQEFENTANDMEFEVWGNKISGPPRTFSSGNRGWYAGGKIQVQVGKKTVWAQIGVNVTIIGSKDWKEK